MGRLAPEWSKSCAKVLSTQTALGTDRENYFSLVVLLVFIKKNIPLDKDAVMHAALNLGEQQT